MRFKLIYFYVKILRSVVLHNAHEVNVPGVMMFGGGAVVNCEIVRPRGGDLSQGTCGSLSDTLDRGAVTGLNMKGS